MKEIINKTNNIPIKFDLYISTDTKQKMDFTKNYVDRYSKANDVSIIIIENKGRDVLPFLIQMKDEIYKYKLNRNTNCSFYLSRRKHKNYHHKFLVAERY